MESSIAHGTGIPFEQLSAEVRLDDPSHLVTLDLAPSQGELDKMPDLGDVA